MREMIRRQVIDDLIWNLAAWRPLIAGLAGPSVQEAITQTTVFHPDRDRTATCACCLQPVEASAGPGLVR